LACGSDHSFVDQTDVKDGHFRTRVEQLKHCGAIQVDEHQLTALIPYNHIPINRLNRTEPPLPRTHVNNLRLLHVINRHHIHLPLCRQEREINLFPIIDPITGHKGVIKHDNVPIEFEPERADLSVVLVDDVSGEVQHGEVHLARLVVGDDFYLLDGLGDELEDEALRDGEVFGVFD